MRENLRDGQWADIRERIDHGTHKRIKVAIRKAEDDDVAAVELDDVVIRAFVTDWSVKDIDGQPIPLTDTDALDRLPSDVADALLALVLAAHKQATVPNAPTGS